MCGIVGYIGKKPAAPLLLEGLSKLEYRGYDSAGVALLGADGLSVEKHRGRLSVLAEYMQNGVGYTQTVGIGHTRWATHGKPSDENAHPHVSQRRKFALVHNGIIENERELREELVRQGVVFTSETDSEVVVQLMERLYRGNFMAAVQATVVRLKGSFALGILCADFPDEMIAVRCASPLIVGLAAEGSFIASDIPAVLAHTRRVLPLADHELVRLTAAAVQVFDARGNRVEKPVQQVEWNVEEAEKGGYAHFMLKEIMEQPRAIAAALAGRIDERGTVSLPELDFPRAWLERLERLVVVACGSAYHAGMAGRYFLEKTVELPVEVELASEFRYREPLVNERTLVIVISQSGETADSLAALREAKARGTRVLSIVNVVGSSIAAESDGVLYTHAGPEIAVATTKGYTTQVCLLYLLGMDLAGRLGRRTAAERAQMTAELQKLPALVEKGLKLEAAVREQARVWVSLEHAYFIGRHVDYAVALEASLKLKEISYIHSEAYAAGELKHGTISLVEEGTFVVALACQSRLLEKTRANIREVKARGAWVLVVTDESHADAFPDADGVLAVPDAPERFAAVSEIVPLQLLSYYIALYRGCDVDKPRNLAKSVTVE